MNRNRSCILNTEVDNFSDNNASCGSDIDQYLNVIKNLFVPSWEETIYDGLELFECNQYDNLSSQCPKKCLDVVFSRSLSEICERVHENDVGVIEGIIRPMIKSLIKDGLIDCFINAIVLNNRLNKICRDLTFIHYSENIRSIATSAQNFFNYDNNNDCHSVCRKKLSHTSFESINSSSLVHEFLEDYYADNNLKKHDSNILIDDSTSSEIHIITEDKNNSYNCTGRNKKNAVVQTKMTMCKSSKIKSCKSDKLISGDKQIKYTDINPSPSVVFPCNCETTLREMMKTNSSSSGSQLVDEIKKLESVMKVICFSFSDIIAKNSKNNQCNLLFKIREKYHYLKFKQHNNNESMANLFVEQINVNRRQDTNFPYSKSLNNTNKGTRSSSHVNFVSKEIFDKSRHSKSALISDSGQNIEKNNFLLQVKTEKNYNKNNDVLIKENCRVDFLINTDDSFEECNFDSCSCLSSTKSSQNISTCLSSTTTHLNNDYDDKHIFNEKNTFSTQFKIDSDHYRENKSVSTQKMNLETLDNKDSTSSNIENDFIKKLQIYDIIKEIFEEKKESVICSCNEEQMEEVEKFANEQEDKNKNEIVDEGKFISIERDEIKDNSSNPNHVVICVGSDTSVNSKITQIIPSPTETLKIMTEFSTNNNNNFDYFGDLNESALNKRTSTPERKKEIEKLLNSQDYEVQSMDKNKMKSYSSRDLSEILGFDKGDHNYLANIQRDELNHGDTNKNVINDSICNLITQNNDNNKNGENLLSNKSHDNMQSSDNNNDNHKNESAKQTFSQRTSEIITMVKQRRSTILRRDDKYDENNAYYHDDEIVERTHNLQFNSSDNNHNSHAKNLNINSNNNNNYYKIIDKKNSRNLLQKNEKKSNDSCGLHLLHDITENTGTSTPERKRDIERLLINGDLKFNKKDSMKNGQNKIKNQNAAAQEELAFETKQKYPYKHRDKNNDYTTSRQSIKNTKVHSYSKISRQSQDHVNYVKNLSTTTSNLQKNTMSTNNKNNTSKFCTEHLSTYDISSICVCDSDSDNFQDEIGKIPIEKNQLLKNSNNNCQTNKQTKFDKNNYINDNYRKKTYPRPLVSTIYKCVKNFLYKQIFKKLKNFLKKKFCRSAKTRHEKAINTSEFCIPKTCINKIPKDTREIVEPKKVSKYTCCREQNNSPENVEPPRLINSCHSLNVSTNSCDCDSIKKYIYHRKYTRRKLSRSQLRTDNDKKKYNKHKQTSCSSLTSLKLYKPLKSCESLPQSHPCSYYKNIAAKHLAKYLNYRLKQHDTYDTNEIHSTECLESTDSELKSLLNQYLEACRSEKKYLNRGKCNYY